MALMTQAEGRSVTSATVFENRLYACVGVQRMGAQIHLQGSIATVDGPTPLTGAPVQASDLRASASLVWPAWWRRARPSLIASTTSIGL